MTDNEKELVATIKLSLLRAIVDLDEETLAMAIKVPKLEEPSDDCVSRQAVLERINDWWGIASTSGEPTLCDCIRELPPITPTQRWIPVSERLPKEFEFVNCTCHSLIDDREDWVVETVYIPQPSDSPYSDWGNIPMLNSGDCEVVAWVHRDIPKPYKAEMESEE